MFPGCVREIYISDNETSSLRSAIVETAVVHSRDLSQTTLFQNVIRDVDDFAVDVLKVLAKNAKFPYGWGL